MPRWRALPDELDPQVREFASQLRRLVDRSGLSVAAVADRTGYSKTSWERYLNGRLLPPQGAVVALAEVTGANAGHLTTMWELAERAWSRSEMRHDHTMEAIRVAQARAALGEFGPPPAKAGKRDKARPESIPRAGSERAPDRSGPAGLPPRVPPNSEAAAPAAHLDAGYPADAAGPIGRDEAAGPHAADHPGRPQRPGRGEQSQRRRVTMFLTGVVGALLVIAAAVLLLGLGKDDGAEAAKAPPTPAASKGPDLPAGVKCTGDDCTGKDPENMGCGGQYAETVSEATVGGAFIEVRYSKVCGAAWARITEAAPGDSVRITAAKETESGTADQDNDGYTQMVAVSAPDRVKACAQTKAGESGCTVPGGN
ncbi:DUF2690 domain-containing protein [Streptomyces sp. NPDC004647]|uniref:helix-turn-helix domain-containing protein n=1 Tax=Streptomyces sp. NPDC004647 TaxID=3154671 RepID=UPI0033B34774